ncbi:uncharacterized protein LOC124717155 [Schistocerca piceifrons]|uniref:uncharacterized protein LOC124717155 n=1 Tax=Schistocerca piceifrons TaxID=274613 RepID=UPI001F5ECE2F|nr:uncharacterized protein LOC124717155 [Schistocerca piceifrons]
MFLRPVCLVLLVACLAVADDSDDHRDSRGEIVQCIPHECNKPCNPPPYYCPSGVVKNCGCCDVCWIHLKNGERCHKKVPENTMCGPHLVCGSKGVCVPLARENVEDDEDSSDSLNSSE